jgi:hypothetical protein
MNIYLERHLYVVLSFRTLFFFIIAKINSINIAILLSPSPIYHCLLLHFYSLSSH